MRVVMVSAMISFADALALISTKVQTRRRKSERVSIDASLGRVCASDVFSIEKFPSRATSAMDGFAIHAELTSCASAHTPFSFAVRGEIAAGDEPPAETDGGVWEIMTGAAMPADCDACVRLEDVERDGSQEIRISAPVAPMTNVRQPAEDFCQGDLLLRSGSTVRSEDILCLATLGIESVEMIVRPKIAIIATGKELLPAHAALKHSAQVRNSTTPFLMAALREQGADPFFLGTVSDEPHAFHETFAKANSGEFDLILTTGALSIGRHDFVASALKAHGTNIFFQKVAMRPGKPLLFGQTQKGVFVIGLPGNPVATVLGFRFFVRAFLRSWFGQGAETALELSLGDKKIAKPPGSSHFIRASISGDGRLVTSYGQQKASLLKPLLHTDAWIELAPDQIEANEGDRVRVWPYSPTPDRRKGPSNF